MEHKLTKFIFYYNTPFTDYQNTVHFESNEARDNYFLNEQHFPSFSYEKAPFNFIRDRQEVNVDISWEKAQGLNYCTFHSDFENRRYYAFINEINYINDHVVKIKFVIDTLMTFTQGNALENIGLVQIDRQHLTKDHYMEALPSLRNNDDVLKASNKYYVSNYMEQFYDNYVLFQSSADLSKKFGTKKEPNLDTSKGTTYDKITSPVNLYVMEYEDFNDFMDKMSKYPWITQNFQKVQLIPKRFIDDKDLEVVKNEEDIKGLKTLKKNASSNNWTLNNLTLSFKDLQKILGVTEDKYKHLIRNEYMTIELYTWNGDSLLLDAGKITEKTGVKFNTRSIIGYHNEVRVYPVDYNSSEYENAMISQNGNVLIDRGSFLNTCITFDAFAEVPILIDNGILGQSQQANRQKNAESQLVSNRLKNIATGSDPKSKFYDAVSIASNLSPTSLFSKFNEEYNFYNQQRAEYKDLALQPPSTTSSEMGNAFQIANNINGLTMKIGIPTVFDLRNIIKYYLLFGYDNGGNYHVIDPIDSMTVCNYLKISGTYTIPNVDAMLVVQLKALLETGVRFWHNDGTDNPMLQDILKNDFRK